jgi:hypothetical protein
MNATPKDNFNIYIWDNGEDFLDHSVWFIETDLEPGVVEEVLDAAVDSRSRRGGVVAVIPSRDVAWRQGRIETLANWFTCYGDQLVDWRNRAVHESLRKLPIATARELSYRLYPSNAEIVAENLGFEA